MTPYRFADRAVKLEKRKPPDIPKASISFASGLANPEELPQLAEIASQVLTDQRTEVLQYGPVFGLQALLDWIVEYSREDGIKVDRDNIIIVNGAKHGLDLICRVFINPGDSVVVTSATYMVALNILRGYEVNFITIDQDDEGLNVPLLQALIQDMMKKGEPLPKVIFDIPDFHNPTGITLSQRRREQLVHLAERHGIIIAEDDPYRRIRFNGDDIPPVKSFDTSGCVIGLGTFSKMVSPGLRVGWVTATADIVKRISVFKSDGGSCPLTQCIVYRYCSEGHFTEHVEKLIIKLRQHRDLMLECIHKYLPGAAAHAPQGGYFLWVQLPSHMNSDLFLSVAQKHDVSFYPASAFHAMDGPANYIRLCYSYYTLADIEKGMKRLGLAYDECRLFDNSKGNGLIAR